MTIGHLKSFNIVGTWDTAEEDLAPCSVHAKNANVSCSLSRWSIPQPGVHSGSLGVGSAVNLDVASMGPLLRLRRFLSAAGVKGRFIGSLSNVGAREGAQKAVVMGQVLPIRS